MGAGKNDARRRVRDPFVLLKGFLRRNPIGALAQLGEHLLCKQRVIGSIPIGSTKNCGHVKRTGVERLWRFVRAGSVAQVVRAHA